MLNVQYAILQSSVQWPGLCMAARVEVTFFLYIPYCFCCVNQIVQGLYQNEDAYIYRPGNWERNCKMTYLWENRERSGINDK